MPAAASVNYEWTKALRKSNFFGDNDGISCMTFTPDRQRFISGRPLDELSEAIQGKLPNRSQVRVPALGCALLAGIQAASTVSEACVCGFIHATNNNAAGGVPGRYKKSVIAPTGLATELKLLASEGYLDEQKGFKGKGYPKGLMTLWFPTDKLVAWIVEHENELTVARLPKDSECIILKNSSKQFLDYPDCDLSLGMRKVVAETNAARVGYAWRYWPTEADGITFKEQASSELNQEELDQELAVEGVVFKRRDELDPQTEIAERTLDKESLVCRRVFRDDFKSGGRFYCAAQSLRKAERSSITIDDKPTIEIDYKSLHPRMLYNINNLESPVDCYSSGETEQPYSRSLLKSAGMMVINCGSPKEAVAALRNKHKVSRTEAEECLSYFESMHKPIAHEFYSASWDRLQFADSQLVEKVLTKCLAESIPVLPVHDSFITTTEDAMRMNEFINEAYKELFGFDPVLEFGDDPDFSEFSELVMAAKINIGLLA